MRRGLEQRGSVIVFTAVAMQVILLFLALAIDIGNWYVHKRQIQSRVDNAALAAALAYGYNFPACTTTPSLAANIVTTAKQYAGADGVSGAVNTGVNEQANVDVVVNGTSLDSADGSDDGNIDPDTLGTPCYYHPPDDLTQPDGGYWVDVKARERDVASLFGGIGVGVPAITAAARVRVMNIGTASNVQPFLVSDTTSARVCAWARFSNNNGAQAPVPLGHVAGTSFWTTTAEVNKDGDHLSVSVILSGGGPSCPGSPPSGSVEYANVGYVDRRPTSQGGVSVGEVALTGTTCNGGYVYFGGAPCAVSVTAQNVTFSPLCPDEDQEVYAYLDSPGNDEVLLTGGPDSWVGDIPIDIDPGSGAAGTGTINVGIRAKCGAGGFDNLGPQQRIMAGTDTHEGPIRNFTLSTTSFTGGGTFTETITLDLVTLDAVLLGDNALSVIRGTVSGNALTGGISCASSPATSTADAVRVGCPGPFGTPGNCTAVPDTMCDVTVSDPGGLDTAYNAAWCNTTNNWASYPATMPRDDPRLITVAVTPLGNAFTSGATRTIDRFAAFYVTGWSSATSCSTPPTSNDPQPDGLDPSGSSDAIWGHFVKFVRPPSSGTPATTACPDQLNTPPDVTACMSTLVR